MGKPVPGRTAADIFDGDFYVSFAAAIDIRVHRADRCRCECLRYGAVNESGGKSGPGAFLSHSSGSI